MWLVVNIIILLAVVIGFVLFVLNYSIIKPSEEPAAECVDINNIASFVHDTCYDAYTKNIFIELKRSYDIYNIKSISLSFFDFSEQTYKIIDIPNINQTKSYKILEKRAR